MTQKIVRQPANTAQMSRKEYAVWLGGEIRSHRLACRMSQREVGDLLGVHRNTIFRWEHGQELPDAFHLRRLELYLGPEKGKVAA